MGVSYSLVSRYENEERNPSLAYLHRFNLGLNLSPVQFSYLLNLGNKEQHTPHNITKSKDIDFIWSIEEKIPSTELNYLLDNREGGEKHDR